MRLSSAKMWKIRDGDWTGRGHLYPFLVHVTGVGISCCALVLVASNLLTSFATFSTSLLPQPHLVDSLPSPLHLFHCNFIPNNSAIPITLLSPSPPSLSFLLQFLPYYRFFSCYYSTPRLPPQPLPAFYNFCPTFFCRTCILLFLSSLRVFPHHLSLRPFHGFSSPGISLPLPRLTIFLPAFPRRIFSHNFILPFLFPTPASSSSFCSYWAFFTDTFPCSTTASPHHPSAST